MVIILYPVHCLIIYVLKHLSCFFFVWITIAGCMFDVDGLTETNFYVERVGYLNLYVTFNLLIVIHMPMELVFFFSLHLHYQNIFSDK